MSRMTYVEFVNAVRAEFPSFKIVNKSDSFFMRTLSLLLLVVTFGQLQPVELGRDIGILAPGQQGRVELVQAPAQLDHALAQPGQHLGRGIAANQQFRVHVDAGDLQHALGRTEVGHQIIEGRHVVADLVGRVAEVESANLIAALTDRDQALPLFRGQIRPTRVALQSVRGKSRATS